MDEESHSSFKKRTNHQFWRELKNSAFKHYILIKHIWEMGKRREKKDDDEKFVC